MSSSLKKQNIMQIAGMDEFIKKLDKISDESKKKITKALEKGAELPKQDMLDFVSEGMHYVTGATKQSWSDLKVEWDGNKLVGAMGFDADKGGFPSIFLDLGTPTITPTYFIYYAQRNNWHAIEAIFNKTIKDILKEVT